MIAIVYTIGTERLYFKVKLTVWFEVKVVICALSCVSSVVSEVPAAEMQCQPSSWSLPFACP